MSHLYIKDLITSKLSIDNVDGVKKSVASVASISSTDTEDEDTENKYGAFGLGASHAPFRGRSIKEVEEQLSTLQKDNFNLKLRIYFLEERAGASLNLDKETVIKENIELKVELERATREVEEKYELLCQAVKAMEIEEEEHKKMLGEKDEKLSDLQRQLDLLLQRCQEDDDNRSHHNISINTSDAYLDAYYNMQTKTEELESKLIKIESDYQEKEEQYKTEISDYNTLITELNTELANKELQLMCKTKDLKIKEDCLSDKNIQIDYLKKQLTDTQSTYEAEKEKIDKCKNSLNKRNSKIMELEGTIETQKAKILNLETRLDTAQNEVKRKNDQSPLRRLTPQNSDVNSFLVPGASNVAKVSPKMATAKVLTACSGSSNSSQNSSASSIHNNNNQEIDNFSDVCSNDSHKTLEEQITKLRRSEQKACKIIQSLINSRKMHDQEITILQNELKGKDGELKQLRNMFKNYETSPSNNNGTGKNKIHDVNFNGAKQPPTETENSNVEEENQELAYKELSVELEKHKDILVATLKAKDAQLEMIENKYEELLKEYKIKENCIIDLEFELLSSGQDLSTSKLKDEGNEKSANFWIEEIAEKDKEIERLESELRKRTCDLQGIVNNELWEKNREIEKLQKRYGNIIEMKDVEINNLEKDICGKDLQLTSLKDKISELGVHVNLPSNLIERVERTSNFVQDDVEVLHEELRVCKEERKYYMQQMEEFKQQLKNTPERETNKQIAELQIELQQIAEELSKSEKTRKETNDVCVLLNGRLEELACFLDSLLKQKSVLGFLGSKQTKLRQIVDQSIDLSRTLSLSLTLNPDQSLIQLSNISNILESTRGDDMSIAEFLAQGDEHSSVLSILPGNATLTYQSHLRLTKSGTQESTEQNEIINVLREQVENLKKEIELRDHELNKIHEKSPLLKSNNKRLSKSCENQSESESWSEPDRSVSIARIGLMEETLKPLSNINISRRNRASTESTEGEFKIKSAKKQLHNENKQLVADLLEQVCELQGTLKEKEMQLAKADVAVNEMQKLLEKERNVTEELMKDHETIIAQAQEIKTTLKTYQEKYKALKNEKSKLDGVIAELQQSKAVLQDAMNEKDKDVSNRINQLEVERDKALETATRAEKATEETQLQIAQAEEQLNYLRNQIAEIEMKAQDELRLVKDEFKIKIIAIEREAEFKINEIKTKHDTELSSKQNEILKLGEDLNTLQSLKEIVVQAEIKIKELFNSEIMLKQQLREQYSKVDVLRTELDAANLHYSEAILEKTRLINEKGELEQHIQEISNKENNLLMQIEEYQDEIKTTNTDYENRISVIRNEKSLLEVRVSELESTNAELHNKFIKLQTAQNVSDETAPIIGLTINDATNKSYLTINRSFSQNSDLAPCDLISKLQELSREKERQQSTSSPDLGIESDQGRFSSLEAPRPFLRSLEVTASMNNLLDGEIVNQSNCANEQCCVKTKEIINENSDLRRRLLRTRRALEETVTQLTLANQRKKQVEKTICKQIHKTSQVLRKAKANLDSGSESDVIFK